MARFSDTLMRRIVPWAAAVTLGVGSVSPHDLKSNLAFWVEVCGFTPPGWLLHPTVDLVTKAIAAGMFVSWVAYLWWFKEGNPGRPQHRLYMTNPVDSEGQPTEYITAWSPETFLWLPFSDYEGWARNLPYDPHRQSPIVFEVHNPGPEDALHVRIAWSIDGVRAREAVLRTGLFSGSISKLTDSRIDLCSDGIGYRSIPIATKVIETIPVIKAGTTGRVNLPTAIRNSLAIIMLAEAKVISSSPIGDVSGIENMIAQSEQDTRQTPPIELAIRYDTEKGSRRKMRLRVKSIFHGRVGLVRPAKHEKNTFEPEPHGISAWMRNIGIEEV